MFEPDHPGSTQVGPIYSNLDAMEFLRNPNDNSIHFKLAYPRTTNYDQFIWKQTSNPVSQANVEGFEMQQESPAYVKFGLSEKHTKFEKIFLVVLTNQLIVSQISHSIFFNKYLL